MEEKDIKHLEWVYERMKDVHNENENYDYMIKFRQILKSLRGCDFTEQEIREQARIQKIFKKPEPPLSKIIREGVGKFCINCGSTVSKCGLLGLFGEMLCHNQNCHNSRSNKIYKRNF